MNCKYCGDIMIEQDTFYICRSCSYRKNKFSKKLINNFNKLSDEEKLKLLLGDLYKEK